MLGLCPNSWLTPTTRSLTVSPSVSTCEELFKLTLCSPGRPVFRGPASPFSVGARVGNDPSIVSEGGAIILPVK
jgi:hypothetical protein